jgi:hypothetical protein
MIPWTLQINNVKPHRTAVAGIAAASEKMAKGSLV